MKLQKILLVFGMSACLFTAGMDTALGMEVSDTANVQAELKEAPSGKSLANDGSAQEGQTENRLSQEGQAEDSLLQSEAVEEVSVRECQRGVLPSADQESVKEAARQVVQTARKARTGKISVPSAFAPSATFIDNRQKVKYNVQVPIDGIPSFITPEMVVGALKCQDETGYPASVTIAQIIQESGFGKYGPNGSRGQGLSYLAYQYNNLFGIKGTGPAGKVGMRTGEQRADGTRYRTTAGFRVYHTYTECIEDRTELLKRVYSDLTYGVRDANTFALKIGSRWATSISYGQNLIRQMRKYDLYRLDNMTLKEFGGLLGTFVNPCPGSRITSGFGPRRAPIAGASTWHKGIDMGTGGHNLPTYAAEAGVVIYAGYSGSAGNLITIDHGSGLVTKYMHHDRIYVKRGDRVEKGQQIGLSGSTGNATGNHLHFQVEKNGQAVDPTQYVRITK